MLRKTALFAACALTFAASGCGGNRKIVVEDFAEGRVVDLSITEKLVGNHELLFFSVPKKAQFLEGYIQGVVTDYQDNPVQGVVVRAVTAGETQVEESEDRPAGFAGSSFDPGVSDTNGFYRIRFSLPILAHMVDIRGKLVYNPGWEQERDNLGKAYEPQTKQSQFHLYYERKKGRITFTEGIMKTIVAPVNGHPALKPEAGAAQPAAAEKAAEKPAGKEDDLFKGFGMGQ